MYKKYFFVLGIFTVVLIFVATAIFDFVKKSDVQAADTPKALYGWAWGGDAPVGETPSYGDTGNVGGVGWISFNCALNPGDQNCINKSNNYNVLVDSSGYLNGYAWSSNFGWIKFGGLKHPGGEAKLPSGDGKLSGWAKFVNGGTTAGWDGWIDLSQISKKGNQLSNYAWNGESGEKVYGAGWMNYNYTNADSNNGDGGCNPSISVCVQPQTLTVKCSTKPLSGEGVVGETSAEWKVEVSGGTPPYTYVWSNNNWGKDSPDIQNSSSYKPKTITKNKKNVFTHTGKKMASVSVTDSSSPKKYTVGGCGDLNSVKIINFDYRLSIVPQQGDTALYICEGGSGTRTAKLSELVGNLGTNGIKLTATKKTELMATGEVVGGGSLNFINGSNNQQCKKGDFNNPAGSCLKNIEVLHPNFTSRERTQLQDGRVGPFTVNVESKSPAVPFSPIKNTSFDVYVYSAEKCKNTCTAKDGSAVFPDISKSVTYYTTYDEKLKICPQETLSCKTIRAAGNTPIGTEWINAKGDTMSKNGNLLEDKGFFGKYKYTGCNPGWIEF